MSTQNETLNSTAFILKRLAQALDIEGDDALAKELGVARNTLSTWRNRDSKPYKACEYVAERKMVSIDWLLTGKGPMFRQQEADKPDQTPAPTEDSTTLDPKMTAVIKTVQMMPLEKQQEFIAETQKRAESIKQFLEMQERIERLEKEKCA